MKHKGSKRGTLEQATGLTPRDVIAQQAMHGILTACSSPQYYDRIRERASEYKIPERIAEMAYIQADAMIRQAKVT